jgi:hypothetical protein
MDDLRNVVFDLFERKGAVMALGECLKDGETKSVVIERSKPEAEFTIRWVTRLQAAQAVADKLRRGYERRPAMYCDQVEQTFTAMHPDLSWGRKDWIVAAQPPSVALGIGEVVQAMQTLPGSVIDPVEVQAWAARQEQNAAYIVAFRDLPVWSLVLAETALKGGWPVRANPEMASAPALLPSMNPLEWDQWLQSVFDLKLIQRTRAELGFTLSNIHKPDQQQIIDSENWSALF